MSLPAFILLAAVFLYPMFSSLNLSLHRIELAKPWIGEPFVWLSNYLKALTDSAIWVSLWRTFVFTVISVGLELVLGLVGAVLLNESFRGRGVARAMVIVPWALLTMTNGLMWRWIFNADYGILGTLCVKLGITDSRVVWLADPVWAMAAIIIADVWKMTPFMTLLLLAGLQTIPDELYESAEMDGAGHWQKFKSIALPLLKPAILVAIVLRTMGAFKVFDIIYVLTFGGPGDATDVITFHAYRESFRYFNIGYGSALSWLITIAVLGLVVVYIRLLGTADGERETANGKRQMADGKRET
jgi:ABC-type sugar transport system permease subunit